MVASFLRLHRPVARSFLKPTTARFFASAATAPNASVASLGLDKFGISSDTKVFHNLTYDEIAQHEDFNKEGQRTANGTYTIDTGAFTGRSPKDKYFVDQSPSNKHIWWGEINKPMSPKVFDELYDTVTDHYSGADKVYVFDGYAGANPKSRKRVRFVTEIAWQHHFVTNMFLRPQSREEIDNFQPDFTIVNACKVTNQEYKKHDLNSDVFVAFNIEKDVAVIGGTWYGGEMKKGIFSMLNYWLPLEDVMAMHCSANKGKNGDTALFFGLSGTGKTTLSADPKRYLIGDDEHGWDEDGIYNFEGGCYAKTINLSAENEPDIFNAIKKDALLENVTVDPKTGVPDYADTSKTENGRVSYPIFHIDNHEPNSMGGHPSNVVFLTCDAYGVLPPVAKLSPGQAQFYFLSGYTAKVAGTERGVTEPTATFSACFGAAFLPLHPTKYADLLQKKLEQHGTDVYMVNTGWTGGRYGVGNRMSIKDTRACIDAILDGSIKDSDFKTDEIFGFEVPKTLGNISPKVLDPREAWADRKEFDVTAQKLAKMFQDNFTKYVSKDHTDYSSYGPKV